MCPSAHTVPRISFSYEHEPEFVDPESYDSSEQEFEDSIMSSPVTEYRSIQLGPERDKNIYSEIPEKASQPVSTPMADKPYSPITTGIERQAAEERSLDESSNNWRDEVSSRLSNYAKRRGRKRLGGEYSMQLDFEHPRRINAATAPVLDPVFEDSAPEIALEQSEPMIETESKHDWHPSMTTAQIISSADVPVREAEEQKPEPIPERPKRKHHHIIEFPRLFSIEHVEAHPDELAESVDKPRILDVPEETEQIVLPLADISLEMQQQAEEVPPPREFELPIQVAAMSQRVFAALADCIIVLFATAVFAGIVLNLAKDLPHDKLTLAAAVVIPGIFWAVYHYFFLVHAATTPGMRLAQLRLATFAGYPTTRGTRRIRAIGLMLSFFSAGMGFGWALVDEDTLCWHDRISRTYLTHR